MAGNDFLCVLFRTKRKTNSARSDRTRRLRLPGPLTFAVFVLVFSGTSYSARAPEPPSGSAIAPAMALSAAGDKSNSQNSGEITEDELRQMLVGKQLFLRGAYLGDSLSFNEHGVALAHPAAGSFTLSAVEIDKVRVTKHKVELIGSRYGLHFLGATPYEDPSKAVDRIRITPKKKVLKITIDREQVVKSRKDKEQKEAKRKAETTPQTNAVSVASSETDVVTASQPSSANSAQATPEASAAISAQVKPDTASATPDTPQNVEDGSGEQASDPHSQTTTTSPAHATQLLRDALGRVFASGLDGDMKARMPEFWQLYFKAQAAGTDYHPRDPNVMRSNAVDQQAKLTTTVAPDSNEFAQTNGISGQALYRVVVGADGQPGEIAVERPIGFGLDENAVAAIRKASFSPALRAGKPVAETLDLAVLFRIYSKRTSETAAGEAKPAESVKPGPYSVQEPH